MKKAYGQTTSYQEPPLRSPREIAEKWDQNGFVPTLKELGSNIHERGIRAAGERSLPFYAGGAMLGLLLIGSIAGGALMGASSVLGVLVVLITTVPAIILWFAAPVIIYWDCLAANRYIGESWTLGKLIAVASILLGGTGYVLQFAYRAYKFNRH